ncbi:MAG TPA: type II toxin-antitoxin system death-on-curing family toxin [Bryobacteraceae bacterium]|nr:type II toxin-antitoxin system death-on-curing family toxin [Bryobacteraceae bacterium]
MKQPIWVARQTVDALHTDLLAEHGGAPGLRDEGLLESALARPRQIFAYSNCDLLQLAAAYVTGIVRNHPFVDGNKRSGFMTGYVFLERNGFDFTASEADAAQAVLELAAGTIEETGFALFLRDHVKRDRKRVK